VRSCWMGTLKVRMWSRRMPRSTWVTFQKLRRMRPAPATKINARANSATTSMRRRRLWLAPAEDDLPPSFSMSLIFCRAACQAGKHPKRTPLSSVAASVKSKTGTFRCGSASYGIPN
jgi:hypothetical protein